MKNNKPTRKIGRVRLGFILAGLLLLLGGGAWVYYAKTHHAAPKPVPGINEKTETEEALRQAAEASPAAPTPTSSTADKNGQATPVPTSSALKPTIIGVSGHDKTTATSVTVDALPDNATSGTCTATLTSGGVTRTVTTNISAVTSYYACSAMTFDKAQLTAGAWTLVVSVASPSGSGSSTAQVITVKK